MTTTSTRTQPPPATRRPPKPRPPAGAARKLKHVLTTGQIARLCGVAPRTAAGFIDSGKLKGYRVPGSQDRRVPREEVLRFMLEHGMPVPDELALAARRTPRLLAAATALLPWLRVPEGWECEYQPTLFGVAMSYRDARHEAVLFDLSLGRMACLHAACGLRFVEGTPPVLLAFACDDEQAPEELAAAFDHVVTPGDDLGAILTEAATS